MKRLTSAELSELLRGLPTSSPEVVDRRANPSAWKDTIRLEVVLEFDESPSIILRLDYEHYTDRDGLMRIGPVRRIIPIHFSPVYDHDFLAAIIIYNPLGQPMKTLGRGLYVTGPFTLNREDLSL